MLISYLSLSRRECERLQRNVTQRPAATLAEMLLPSVDSFEALIHYNPNGILSNVNSDCISIPPQSIIPIDGDPTAHA